MTASLTPTLAIDFITALSADIRAAAVLDARGDPLAGPAKLAAAARALARGEDAAGSAGARGDDDAGSAGGGGGARCSSRATNCTRSWSSPARSRSRG
jgi:hypothetical protein